MRIRSRSPTEPYFSTQPLLLFSRPTASHLSLAIPMQWLALLCTHDKQCEICYQGRAKLDSQNLFFLNNWSNSLPRNVAGICTKETKLLFFSLLQLVLRGREKYISRCLREKMMITRGPTQPATCFSSLFLLAKKKYSEKEIKQGSTAGEEKNGEKNHAERRCSL